MPQVIDERPPATSETSETDGITPLLLALDTMITELLNAFRARLVPNEIYSTDINNGVRDTPVSSYLVHG